MRESIIPYTEVTVAVGALHGSGVENRQIKVLKTGNYNFSVKKLDVTEITQLLNNYLMLMCRCPIYSLTTKKTSEFDMFSGTALKGSMLEHAVNYFNLIKQILQQKLTNAIQSPGGKDIEKITNLKNLMGKMQNAILEKFGGAKIKSTCLEPAGDPNAIYSLLEQAISMANAQLPSLTLHST